MLPMIVMVGGNVIETKDEQYRKTITTVSDSGGHADTHKRPASRKSLVLNRCDG